MTLSQRKSLRKKKGKKTKPKRAPLAVKRSQRQDVKTELVRMTDAVRQKFRNLKEESDSIQQYFEHSAKPLVGPLKQQLVESVKDIKKEPSDSLPSMAKVEASDVDIQTDPGVDVSTQTEAGLVSSYLQKLSSFAQEKLDPVYGVRPDGSGGAMIGDSKITFTTARVYVQDRSFNATQGLMELLFMQVPKKNLIEKEDLQSYKEILLLTNAHRQHFSADKPINANKGKKYTSVISVLFKPEKSGSGLMDRISTFNDVNEIVDRLRILILSKSAGHSGHDEEIEYLKDILRQNVVIA